ncbi:MAG: SAM-dependent DNA methyltransferase [Armatimonadetes bacterium]|nr:SAM-dependent DNA methyltransferase [Armatimonadota bacterium]
MPSLLGHITERTLYDPLMQAIRQAGGSGVQEVRFNSEPDIVFDLCGHRWLLSVKIGEDARTLKGAFLQYLRHKGESGIDFGMLALFPTAIRNTIPEESMVVSALDRLKPSVLVDAGPMQEELRDRPFAGVLGFLIDEVIPALEQRQVSHYPMDLVVSLLQVHVEEMMRQLPLDEATLLRIVTDEDLLTGLGNLPQRNIEAVGRFLASYIFLSQVMFFRLLWAARPRMFDFLTGPPSASLLRQAFRAIVDENYRMIYGVDVLGCIPDSYVADTFNLIWGLSIEKVRYELPGRIFHELMPTHIRKMLAAFYTRPLAAALLAHLSIESSADTVFDPACGSGTILVAAYRRKLELCKAEGIAGNPHTRFCEREIFGADIMPFSVHLASANLAGMDPGTTIGHTQIIQGDSLNLEYGVPYSDGPNVALLPIYRGTRRGRTSRGEDLEIKLQWVDRVLMNPPFTKVERGIGRYVNMGRFAPECGGEVGLWGHFLALTKTVLRDGGRVGAVLPINVLRGRESRKVRELLFREWTPVSVLKATANYGFSEWAEYRDVLLVAERRAPEADHQVKFCLVKKDLKDLDEEDVRVVGEAVRSEVRDSESELADTWAVPLADIHERMDNLMWFCSGTSLSARRSLMGFADRFAGRLGKFPARYFREGYRPVPRGVSQFMFVTRGTNPARVEEAFLRLIGEEPGVIKAASRMLHERRARGGRATHYALEADAFVPSLRTGIGLSSFDITGAHDYVACAPYPNLGKVIRASGFQEGEGFNWRRFWRDVEASLGRIGTQLVCTHRINPFSPQTMLFAFYSETQICPSNVLNVVVEPDPDRARAVCVLMNSALFLSHFFLLKEESGGRYVNIRFYDLEAMPLCPTDRDVPALCDVFNQFARSEFPALRDQLDQNFEARYREFWEEPKLDRTGARRLPLQGVAVGPKPIQPDGSRVAFDLAVCEALGVRVRRRDLEEVYRAIVNEMVLVRHLARD